jgi:Flp pilus assembly protein TadG
MSQFSTGALKWLSHRRNRRRGQAAIETALVIVPLFFILLAIIDVSVAIFIMDTLEYAARDGVRYAILGNTDASVRQAVRDNSLGFLASAPDSQITVNYYALNAGNNTWQVTTGAGSNANGNLVKVSVKGYSWAWMVPYMWGENSVLSMNVASADISGACTNAVCPSR